jgi:hypothetical protein
MPSVHVMPSVLSSMRLAGYLVMLTLSMTMRRVDPVFGMRRWRRRRARCVVVLMRHRLLAIAPIAVGAVLIV